MKNIVLFALFGVLISFSSLALASDQDIYVVDVQKIIDQSKVGRDAQAQIEKEVAEREKKINDLKASFEAEVKSYESQAAVLSDEVKKTKAQELAKKEYELQGLMQREQQAMLKRRDAALAELVVKISAATEKVGRNGGYKLIVEKTPLFVVWSRATYDITDEVMEEVDDA